MEEPKEEAPKIEAPPKEAEVAKETIQETSTSPEAMDAAKAPTTTDEKKEVTQGEEKDTTTTEEKKEVTKEEEKDTTIAAAENVEMKDAAVVVAVEEKKRKEVTPDTGSTNKRERRSRKSAETFTPTDFVHTDRSVQIIDGRGKKLGELKATRDSIEQYTSTANETLLLHKLLFTQRGKPPKKELKANILAFSGYLPKKEKDLGKKEQDAKDEEHEAKMGAKAYKLTIPQLKSLCDFLAVDRTNCSTKDSLIDVLLDFLGQPSNNALKGSKSPVAKKAKTSKSKSKAAASKDDVGEDDDNSYSDIGNDEIIQEGDEITDEALRKWVRAYVRCHSMKSSTIKNALEIAGEKFGADLSDKKARMKELLTEEM